MSQFSADVPPHAPAARPNRPRRREVLVARRGDSVDRDAAGRGEAPGEVGEGRPGGAGGDRAAAAAAAAAAGPTPELPGSRPHHLPRAGVRERTAGIGFGVGKSVHPVQKPPDRPDLVSLVRFPGPVVGGSLVLLREGGSAVPGFFALFVRLLLGPEDPTPIRTRPTPPSRPVGKPGRRGRRGARVCGVCGAGEIGTSSPSWDEVK